MQQPSEELIRKARTAQSPEEIVRIAEENGTPITDERAAELYERMHGVGGEIADDELDDVAGGCSGGSRTCPWCGGRISTYPEADYCDGCGRKF